MNLISVIRALTPALAAALILAGCVNYSGISPRSTAITGFSMSLSTETIQWPEETWWNAYDDTVLSGLIMQALDGNPTVKLAMARLDRVAALTKAAKAESLPQASLNLSMTPERFTENGVFPPPFAGEIYSNNLLMVNAKYEFDFWGKNRAILDSALSSEKAAKAELQSARIIIAASVAKSYFSLARWSEQKKIMEAILQQNSALLAISRQRLDAGLDTQQEWLVVDAKLPAIRAEISKLEEQITLSRNALAALAGQHPDTTQTIEASLPSSLTVTVPVAIPANLIGRRADIAAARSRVEAASKEIDIAKTAFYPNVDLTAFAGLSSLGFANWFKRGSRDYGAGAAFSLPIFDGGRLRANLEINDANYDSAVESYNQTLIEAVHDVADQINALHSLAQQQKQQADLLQSAESIYQLAQLREQAGLINKVPVLIAQSDLLTQQSAAIDLKARALDLSVNLNRALGGGFNDSIH